MSGFLSAGKKSVARNCFPCTRRSAIAVRERAAGPRRRPPPPPPRDPRAASSPTRVSRIRQGGGSELRRPGSPSSPSSPRAPVSSATLTRSEKGDPPAVFARRLARLLSDGGGGEEALMGSPPSPERSDSVNRASYILQFWNKSLQRYV